MVAMSENDEKRTLVDVLANLIEEARDEPQFTAAEHALMAAGEIERAGLLARPLPTRDEIARLVWECATTPCGTCPEGGVDWVTCCIYCTDEAEGTADAVLAILEGGKR